MSFFEGDIVVLTGAGISAESGLATFRGDDGLWEGHRVEDVATPEAFLRNPELVHAFYNARRARLFEVAPNPAHLALTHLQKVYSRGAVHVITQNVDDLHVRAKTDVWAMHGALRRVRCLACQGVFEWDRDCFVDTPCPDCGAIRVLRPDIVWFGEVPYFLDEIGACLAKVRCFVAIGTSGLVYPAAGFVAMAREVGALTVEINLQKTAASALFARGYYGLASEMVSAWVDEVLECTF